MMTHIRDEGHRRRTLDYGKPRLKPGAYIFGPMWISAAWNEQFGYRPSKRRLRREFARLRKASK